MKCCSDIIQLAFVFILVPLLTTYVTYRSSLRGSAGLEKPSIQEACVQLITPDTCLMKVVRRQIYRFAMKIYIYVNCETGEGNGTPLQYSCLENPIDGGA